MVMSSPNLTTLSYRFKSDQVSDDYEIQGQVFAPRSSRSQPATLIYDGLEFIIKDDFEIIAEDLELETIQGKRDIYFTDGRMFTAFYDFPPGFAREVRGVAEPNATRFEVIVPKSALSIALVLMLFAGGLIYAILNLGNSVAPLISRDVEAAIGRSSYASMQGFLFGPTQVTEERQAEIRDRMHDMIAVADLETRPDLYFHSSARLGANAVAFPGGPIVVTDELITILDDDEMIMAVIAHELSHIEDRHSLKQIIDAIGLIGMTIYLFGGDESIIAELSAFGVNFWGYKNTRDFETQADLHGIDILRVNAIDAETYIAALTKIHDSICAQYQQSGEACAEAGTSWLSTHPGLHDRIDAIRNQ